MSFKVFFDGPFNYTIGYNLYTQGGSPYLLDKIIEILEEQVDQLEEINILWYLYNNQILHDYLKILSSKGVRINVVTIPLEGYDDKKFGNLVDLNTGVRQTVPVTKYSLAKSIFGEVYKSDEDINFKVYFFGNMYVRSKYVKPFSRGLMPYSLHLKSAYIKKKNGYILLLSSSNLAVRDLVKYESLICIQDEPNYEEPFKQFCSDLIRNSINIREITKETPLERNKLDFIKFEVIYNSYITAPFYFDSANILDKLLCDFICAAKSRIIVCAQHLAAYNYQFDANYHSKIEENETRQGILGAIISMANQGVTVTCLSQTFAPPSDAHSKFGNIEFSQPLNTKHFQQFYLELESTRNSEYYVNNKIHSKFIIVDDKVIFCTYNFTPTQFIFLDNVVIESFDKMPGQSFTGIHCEVGAHVLIDDEMVLIEFLKNVETMKKDEGTFKVL